MNYLLEKDEWIKMCQDLTYAEIKVYFYLKMEKNTEINVSKIAETLKISRRTVQRTLNVLSTKGFIALRRTIATYKIYSQEEKNEQKN
jgi:predicted transcriptional regulator